MSLYSMNCLAVTALESEFIYLISDREDISLFHRLLPVQLRVCQTCYEWSWYRDHISALNEPF